LQLAARGWCLACAERTVPAGRPVKPGQGMLSAPRWPPPCIAHRDAAARGVDGGADACQQVFQLGRRQLGVAAKGRHLVQPLAAGVGAVPAEAPLLRVTERARRPRAASLTQATGLTRARTCGGQRCFAANGGDGAIEYLSGLCGCRTLRVRVISPSSWQPGLAVVFRRRGVSGVVGCRYACRFHPGWGVGPIHRLVCGHSAAGQGAGWSLGSFVRPWSHSWAAVSCCV
jgi:hypothetical protein